ncbi:hypothetical protein CK231_21910 [Mesorhizobium loti]|nr:hypothetical protein [Mesorhizobium loti]PBB11753.1 hypothetical protein CK231_21910 [Mesorhizobium loti]PBC07529.1 hypothetical protein CK230_26520 [Mesorhizobium sp. WSM3859]
MPKPTASCERCEEEADGRTYRDIDNARNRIGEFINVVYDKQRLHSAIDYQSPDEHESGPTRLRREALRQSKKAENCY